MSVQIWFFFAYSTGKSNQIKSLLLSHHHSTSALVSEILMSVLQTVQKKTNNLHMDRQCKKTTNNLHMDRQCKKKTNNLHMDRQCKKQQTIYIWTDSAKNCTGAFTVLQTVPKKNNNNLHMDSTYLQTVQKTMCKIHIHILSTHSVL